MKHQPCHADKRLFFIELAGNSPAVRLPAHNAGAREKTARTNTVPACLPPRLAH
jgi:hypothetical protein